MIVVSLNSLCMEKVLEKRLDFQEQNLSKLSINASYNESMRVKEYYIFLRQF